MGKSLGARFFMAHCVYIYTYLCIFCRSWHSEYMCHSCSTESVRVY